MVPFGFAWLPTPWGQTSAPADALLADAAQPTKTCSCLYQRLRRHAGPESPSPVAAFLAKDAGDEKWTDPYKPSPFWFPFKGPRGSFPHSCEHLQVVSTQPCWFAGSVSDPKLQQGRYLGPGEGYKVKKANSQTMMVNRECRQK